MKTLLFKVEGQRITRIDNIIPVAKCRNLYKAHFDFLTPEWEGTKTAIFSQRNYSKAQILDEKNECMIPWEFFDTEINIRGSVTVFCGDLVTANSTYVDIEKAGYQNSDATVPPTPDVYQQMIDILNAAKKIAQGVRDDADAGKFHGENGESAYQIAIRLGFRGTEQEWIESLKYDHSEEFTKLAAEVRNTASGIVADRQQIGQNKADVTQLKEALSRVEKDLYIEKEIEKNEWIDIDLTNGYSDGCFNKDKKQIDWTGMNYSHHVYDVKEGEKYKINARVPDANIPLIVFTDIENNTIDFLPNPITTVRITSEVIIPAGSTKMYVNHNGVTDNTNSYYLWELSKYVVTPAVIEKKPIKDYVVSNLLGKKIVCNGDSIVKGQGYYGNVKGDKSYVNIVAEKYNMTCINYAVSGGTLSSGSNTSVHHICDDVMNMDADADYIIVGGGYNDWLYNTPLGEITNNYTDEINANSRVIGGVELLCRNLLSKFKGKKIGFVFSHKIKESPYTKNNAWDSKPYTMTECHDSIISVLKKYSIPYLDLYNDSALNTALSDYLLYTANSDGTHPTKEGYEIFYCDKFENFLLSL